MLELHAVLTVQWRVLHDHVQGDVQQRGCDGVREAGLPRAKALAAFSCRRASYPGVASRGRVAQGPQRHDHHRDIAPPIARRNLGRRQRACYASFCQRGDRMRSSLLLVWIVALGLAVAPHGRAAEAPPDSATRDTMREIYAALCEILPRCLSSERFAAPGEREIVRAELEKIAARADSLARHTGATRADFAARGP